MKPANLLLGEDGRLRVGDFGIATAAGLDSLTLTGTVGPELPNDDSNYREAVDFTANFAATQQLTFLLDAVFATPDGGYDVVDWKTGNLPRSRAERDAVAVQLAAYRLAWSALADVPLDKVRAAFYYVRHDRTVRLADLLDTGGLAELIARVPAAG